MIGTGEQKQASNTTAVDLRERSSKEGLASGFVLIADDGEDPYGSREDRRRETRWRW